MSSGPSPIRTRYAGILFRSRLEARWAVFFDVAGVRWEYEAEGWRMSDGTLYVPDFYWPDVAGGTFVEVKHENVHWTAWQKINQFHVESGRSTWRLRGSPRNALDLAGVEYDRWRNEVGVDAGPYDAACQAARTASFWDPEHQETKRRSAFVPFKTGRGYLGAVLDWHRNWKPTAQDIANAREWGLLDDCPGYDVSDAGWSAHDDDCPSHRPTP